MALLELRDVKKSYGGVKVLDGGNLILEEGEIAAVVGYSGSGKTTLVGVASGLVQQDSGIARFDGADIRGPSRDRGVVFQTYALLPWMSVRMKVMAARVKVTEMLPLTLAPKGKIGISPIRLLMRMKKNTVSRKGMKRA